MEDRRSVTIQDYKALTKVFIIVTERTQAERLRTELAQRGFDCVVASKNDKAIEQIAGQYAGVALLEVEEPSAASTMWELVRRLRQEVNIPVIALMSREALNGFDSTYGIDDFVVKPWDAAEISARMKRVLGRKGNQESKDTIRCGDLVINLAKCEVSLGAKAVALTFKEYQLLKFLANNKGKVFTRDILLDKVWGWDYYGGDRTVDVHVRRLRSKIEDSTHSFIETVRNIGYKFKDV
jgi:DNA-binding response OmpR family regulator